MVGKLRILRINVRWFLHNLFLVYKRKMQFLTVRLREIAFYLLQINTETLCMCNRVVKALDLGSSRQTPVG